MLPEEQTVILNRLRSAEGHLHAVISMVETDRSSEEILHQLHAVQSALHISGRLLLQHQVQQSIKIACHHDCPEKRSAELNRLVDLYRFLFMYA